MDGTNLPKEVTGLKLSYAASDSTGIGSSPLHGANSNADVRSRPSTSDSGNVLTPADVASSASKAASAVGSADTDVSVASLGALGEYVVTATRLIASVPSYLGTGIDTSA
jgi:hypothetical protein